MAKTKNALEEYSESLKVFANKRKKGNAEAAIEQERSTASEDTYIVLQAANEAIDEGIKQPDPRDLWHGIWYENEIACMFASSGRGKTILAVQIAEHIAQTDDVIYFDFELTTKQFQKRYTDENGNVHQFPPRLFRARKELKNRKWEYFDKKIIDNIETILLQSKCKIAIIDNISCVGDRLEDGDAAMELMRRLNYLKEKFNFSFLIVAHTPKIYTYFPITENDLAGSRKLYNSFDSVFAIGKSNKGNNLRYIKVLKERNGEEKYDEANVLVCRIEKKDACLRFIELETSNERAHLGKPSHNNAQFVRDVMELYNEGNSYRDIEGRLHTSKSTVERVVKREIDKARKELQNNSTNSQSS